MSKKKTGRMRTKENQPYQDGIFRLLFSDRDRLLELYSAVSGKDYGPETELQIQNTDASVFDRWKNDISFLVEDRLIVFMEQQSTINFNMPVRFLLYCSKTYGTMLAGSKIYGKKAVRLPRPEFFVFYTGCDEFPEKSTMWLSDAFTEPGSNDLELKVTCFNINYPLGAEMLERSRSLQGYSYLIHRIRQFRSEGLSLREAIDSAVKECKEKDILTVFLQTHEGEVRGMLFRALSDDEFRKVYMERGYDEGWEAGMEDGRKAGMEAGRKAGMEAGMKTAKMEAAAKMKEMGLSAELICEATGLSAMEIESL